MKRVLYFFPLNLMKKNAGNVTRAWSIVDYFKTRNFQVDYVYSGDFWGTGLLSVDECKDLKGMSNINNIVALHKKPKNVFSLDYCRYKCVKLFRKWFKKRNLPNFVTPFNRKTFNQLLQANKYDYIIISYVYWADFIRNNKYIGDAKLIVDTHDFITSQEQAAVDIGFAFRDEIDRLNFFDEIWTLSIEEEYLFGQFCKSSVRYVPLTLQLNNDKLSSSHSKKFDLIYIAGDNPHNIKSAKWFFDKIYPNLPNSINICVIGKINSWVPDRENIIKIPQAQSLSSYYAQSRIAICPMLTGTGVKVKVIEALSFGIPVVCTRRGIDGLVNKVDNGCFVADDTNIFLEEILMLLKSTKKYEIAKSSAIRYFNDNHADPILYTVLDKAFSVLEK